MEEGQVACFCIKNCIVYFSLLSEKVIFSYENDNNDSLKLLEATKGGNLAVVRGNFVEIIVPLHICRANRMRTSSSFKSKDSPASLAPSTSLKYGKYRST